MKINLPFIAFLFAGASFIYSCDNIAYSSDNNTSKTNGNGKIISSERTISPFHEIELDGVFNVILSQGTENLKIETDENLQSLILTSVENNILKVKMKDSANIGKMTKINVYISFNDVSKITTTGVGTLKNNGKLNFKNIELQCNGVGATTLNFEAKNLNVNSETVGALTLSGEAKEATINQNGVGAIQAFNLKTENLNLHSEGIGTAEVFASAELNINVSGIGGVVYKGHPKIKNIKSEGIGKVQSAD